MSKINVSHYGALSLIAGLMCVLAAESRSPTPQSPPASTYSSLALPEGQGKALVERVCAGCHEPSLVMFTREDEEGWAVIVQDMVARGAKGTKAELDVLTAYLATNFNRKSGFAPLLTHGARAAADAVDDQQRFAAGREIYRSLCVVCHQADGRGKENVAPSLIGSELVLASAGIPVRIMLHGKRGPTNVMPALGRLISDDQIAATLTYIRREWGHTASSIDGATVKEIRTLTTGRARPWTADELRQAVGQPPKGASHE